MLTTVTVYTGRVHGVLIFCFLLMNYVVYCSWASAVSQQGLFTEWLKVSDFLHLTVLL